MLKNHEKINFKQNELQNWLSNDKENDYDMLKR